MCVIVPAEISVRYKRQSTRNPCPFASFSQCASSDHIGIVSGIASILHGLELKPNAQNMSDCGVAGGQ